MINPKNKKKAAWVSIAIASVAGFEGLRQQAYRDPVGIPTVCFGETKGVRMGDRYTTQQCKDMLAPRVEEFGAGVDACLTRAIGDNTKGAYVSFAYNVGVKAFCNSSVARYENAGDHIGACNSMMKWTKAGGVELPGLVRRRKEERDLCLTPDSAPSVIIE